MYTKSTASLYVQQCWLMDFTLLSPLISLHSAQDMPALKSPHIQYNTYIHTITQAHHFNGHFSSWFSFSTSLSHTSAFTWGKQKLIITSLAPSNHIGLLLSQIPSTPNVVQHLIQSVIHQGTETFVYDDMMHWEVPYWCSVSAENVETGFSQLLSKVIFRDKARQKQQLLLLPFYDPFPGLPRWVGTRTINHSGFCWSKHDEVAVASAEQHASYLHFALEDNHTNTISVRFLRAGCPSWHPTNSVKTLKAQKERKTKLETDRKICNRQERIVRLTQNAKHHSSLSACQITKLLLHVFVTSIAISCIIFTIQRT